MFFVYKQDYQLIKGKKNYHSDIESIKGFKLFSEELIIFNNTKLVKSVKDIIFTSNKSDTLYGTGFWSNFDMTKSQILKPKGTLSKTN